MATNMRGLTQVWNDRYISISEIMLIILSVYCGYSRRKGEGAGRKEDQQGNGQYPKEVQRFRP
jgi:hypothetical protein